MSRSNDGFTRLLQEFAAAAHADDGDKLTQLFPQLQAARVPDGHLHGVAAAVRQGLLDPDEVPGLMRGRGARPTPREQDPTPPPLVGRPDPVDVLRQRWPRQQGL